MSYKECNASTVSDNISVLERAIEHGDDQVNVITIVYIDTVIFQILNFVNKFPNT